MSVYFGPGNGANQSQKGSSQIDQNLQKIEKDLIEITQAANAIATSIVKEKLGSEEWLESTQKKISLLDDYAKSLGEKKAVEETLPCAKETPSLLSSIKSAIAKKVVEKGVDKVLEKYTGIGRPGWQSIEQRLETIVEETIQTKEKSLSIQGVQAAVEKKLNEIQSDKALDKGLEYFTGMKKTDFENVDKGLC